MSIFNDGLTIERFTKSRICSSLKEKAIKLLETFEHKPEKYTEKVNHIFEVLGISLFECYDMTEKLYNEVNEIVSEINNFLNEESSDERKQI